MRASLILLLLLLPSVANLSNPHLGLPGNAAGASGVGATLSLWLRTCERGGSRGKIGVLPRSSPKQMVRLRDDGSRSLSAPLPNEDAPPRIFRFNHPPRRPLWLVFIFTNRRTCDDHVPQPRQLLALHRHGFELQGDTNHVPLEHPGAVHISLCGQRPQRGFKRVDSPGAGGAHQGDGERRPRNRTADGRAREPPFHHFHSPPLLRCCLDIRHEIR